MMRTMYWATWVQVTALMPPSIAADQNPGRPTNTPTPNSRPVHPAHDQADAVDRATT